MICTERVSIQNVMHTTRIMVNPEIPEAYAFKSGWDNNNYIFLVLIFFALYVIMLFMLYFSVFVLRLAVQGVETSGEVNPIDLRVRPSLEEEFLRMHTKKIIAQLLGLGDEVLYVVGCVVDGFVDGAEWW